MSDLDDRVDAVISARQATGQPWEFGEKGRLVQKVIEEYRQSVPPDVFELAAFRSKHFTGHVGVGEALRIQRRVLLSVLSKLGM